MIQWWMEWMTGLRVLAEEIAALRRYVNIQRDRIDNIEKRITDQGI